MEIIRMPQRGYSYSLESHIQTYSGFTPRKPLLEPC